MRLVRKLIVLLLLLAVAAVGLFALPLRNGQPLLTPDDLPPALRTALPARLQPAATPAVVTIYRWRDAQGIWQYGSSPPPDGRPYESHNVDTAANADLFPAAPSTGKPSGNRTTTVEPAPSAPTTPYSTERVQKLFDDARSLRDQSQERQAVQDQR